MRVICQLNGFKLYKAIFRGRGQERDWGWDLRYSGCFLWAASSAAAITIKLHRKIVYLSANRMWRVWSAPRGWWWWSWLVVSQLGAAETIKLHLHFSGENETELNEMKQRKLQKRAPKSMQQLLFSNISRHDFRCVFIATQREFAIFADSTHCPHNCYAKIAFCTMRWAKTLISIHGQSKRGAGFAGGLIAFMVIKARKELKDIRYLIANSLISS